MCVCNELQTVNGLFILLLSLWEKLFTFLWNTGCEDHQEGEECEHPDLGGATSHSLPLFLCLMTLSVKSGIERKDCVCLCLCVHHHDPLLPPSLPSLYIRLMLGADYG